MVHPQYHISGEILVYDMNIQHFQGSGGEENGRIQIRLDPELLEENQTDAVKEQPKDTESGEQG